MNLEELISRMSLEDKIGQLTQYNAAVFISTEAEITRPAQSLGLSYENIRRAGSVLNFHSPKEVKAIQDKHLAEDPNKIPMSFMMDVIHGYRTIYPIPLALACSFDPALAEDCSRMAAKEAVAGGVQVTFTPMVDYARDARWGRVLETGGEEPLVTGRMAQAQIRGFTQGGLQTCVKHYAGYGGAESGRDYNLVECSPRELRQFYLPAYKACLDAGSPMVMPSFNSLNGIPSIANPMLMQQILKDEWGFEGVVISDYNAVGELLRHGVAADLKDAAKLAFENGCDIEMCSAAYFHHLKELVEEGVFTEAQIDAAVLRVLRQKEALGLFDDPYHGADEETAEALYLCQAHRSLCRKAAEECAVLLKNDGLLPLSPALSKVAVIGPYADNHAINGAWSCNGVIGETTTVYRGVAALLGESKVTTAPGCGLEWNDTDTSGFAQALSLAKDADAVILCLGEPHTYSGEGNCRTDLRLPGMQEALVTAVLEVNPNTCVVLFNGRPLDLSAVDASAPAILEMWFPGTEGGHAAANLLFGNANPCGKLTMSFPRCVGQCPIYYNRPNTGRPRWTDSAVHQGYSSDYVDCATLPLYSFGHGLSYSTLRYTELTLSAPQMGADDALAVSVTLRNDSSRTAKEVVQLYMRDRVASVVPAVQQLLDFQKVTLAPGEEKTVVFTVTEPMLRFWDFNGNHRSEPGEFDLMVGCADHFVLKDTFRLV